MLPSEAFFSLSRVEDPARHRSYNEWHQLDHVPENVALPGTTWGERWVRSPDCADGGVVHSSLGGCQYLTMYAFADPPTSSIGEWEELAERCFQWGRRPCETYVTRPLMGFLMVVKGYVAPRVRVSAEALPHRPKRGVIVSIRRMAEPHSSAAHDLYRWEDQERIPDLLTVPGVSGAYTFASSYATLDARYEGQPGEKALRPAHRAIGDIRLTLVFVDEDPVEVSSAIEDRQRRSAVSAHDGDAVSTVLLSGPLRTIVPWEWDWFDLGDDLERS